MLTGLVCPPTSAVHAPSRSTGYGHPHVGSRHVNTLRLKIPKYSENSDLEAFLAQLEQLAEAGGWSIDTRALQLALCPTDDALSRLLLLSPEEMRDYGALVGALQRRFDKFLQPGLLRNELSNRRRKSGEPLRI